MIFKQILAQPKRAKCFALLGCIIKIAVNLKAIEFIRSSIQVDGSQPIPYLNLGKILTMMGQHQHAVDFLKESLKKYRFPKLGFATLILSKN